MAAQRKNSAEAAKRGAQARIRANEQKAAAAAKSKLDGAQESGPKSTSSVRRPDRVEELAGIEKRKRQSERANNTKLTAGSAAAGLD